MSNLNLVKESKPREYKIITFHECRTKENHDELLKILEGGVKVFVMLYNKKMLELKKADL